MRMRKGCISFGMLQLVVRSTDFHETFILAIFFNEISWADASFEQKRDKNTGHVAWRPTNVSGSALVQIVKCLSERKIILK